MRIIEGDCIEAMREMPAASVDAIVTDPPYGLEFMGKEWDRLDSRAYLRTRVDGRTNPMEGKSTVTVPEAYVGGRRAQAWHEAWATEALRVLRPGGHLLAFGGTRTYHRLVCAIEDAGFEIRDTIAWMYGQGFPKSMNVGCRCGEGEPASEHDMRDVPDEDVSAPGGASGGQRSVLLAGLPQPGTPSIGSVPAARGAGGAERLLEGRCDVLAEGGQLSSDQVRQGAAVGVANGARGRLCDGAPPAHGADGWSAADASGSGASSGPRSAEQRSVESRTVADQPGSQDGGGWPLCPGCGKPAAGLGTALKPAFEPIVVARKPLAGTVAGNVLVHGTGALNVDGCRIASADEPQPFGSPRTSVGGIMNGTDVPRQHYEAHTAGRWPANVALDPEAAALLDRQTGELTSGTAIGGLHRRSNRDANCYGRFAGERTEGDVTYGDKGGASRFFYCAKTSSAERNAGLDGFEAAQRDGQSAWAGLCNVCGCRMMLYGKPTCGHDDFVWVTGKPTKNVHPTVKPIALMRWLVRLVTPPGGTVLDPFAGSGTTGCAAALEGFEFVGIEREPEYAVIARARIAWWATHPDGMELVDRLAAEQANRDVAESGQLDLLAEMR